MIDVPSPSHLVARYCDTADEDWLMSYHDKYPSLFLATGGSGHAVKVSPCFVERSAAQLTV